MMTRLFDVLFSALAILILIPFMIPVMIILKLTGEHYIFYRQLRVGKGGKDFEILKFATMLKDSPNMQGGVLTRKGDPRILPFGKFLRKTKINELPQFWNILVGEMSFVGPRPQARPHYELYSPEVRARLDQALPGLTGIGSIVFRDEENLLTRIPGDWDRSHDTLIAPYKGQLEMWYSENKSILNYFLLMFLTLWVVINPSSSTYRSLFKDLPRPPKELEGLL